MMTPPATCVMQPVLLIISPQSCTAYTFVQRTTPVSVSTSTSATCMPPTPTLDTPLLSGCVDWANVHEPVPLAWSMPSLAQNSFHAQLFLPFVSTTLPSSIAKSAASTFSLA